MALYRLQVPMLMYWIFNFHYLLNLIFSVLHVILQEQLT